MRILLVEPNPILASVYIAALGNIGDVSWAKGAQQAVLLADEHKPDVVVLEPQLARHNGVEFLYEFRSYQEWQGVPIMLLTSSDVPDLLSDNMQTLGIVTVLKKSEASADNLVQAVQSVTKAHRL